MHAMTPPRLAPAFGLATTLLRATPFSAVLASLLLVAAPRAADAHPLHTTLTTLVLDGRGGASVSMRGFADDLEAAAGSRPANSIAQRDAALAVYVRSRFALRDQRGTALALAPCGVRREELLVFVCLRTTAASAPVLVEQGVLAERFSDQVNIVRVERGGARSTLLFTRESQRKPLS
jgi:hypothetical protein